MKRKFTKSPVTASQTDSRRFVIAAYDKDNNLLGYLFNYSNSRGCALAKVSTDINEAKGYPSQSSANRALGYYKYFMELYVYEPNHSYPVRQYAHWREDADLEEMSSGRSYTLHQIDGCYMKVIEATDSVTTSSEVSASRASQQGVEIDVDEFEEMIDGDDFNELHYQGKDAVEEQLYEDDLDVEEICGGDAGITQVIQTSDTTFIVTIEANIEYLDSYGDEEEYSGTVNLSYDINTHEITLVE